MLWLFFLCFYISYLSQLSHIYQTNTVIYSTGLPDPLDESEFQQNFNEARSMMEDEANRTRSGFMAGGLGQQGQPTGYPNTQQPPLQTGPQPGGFQPTGQPGGAQTIGGQQQLPQQPTSQPQFPGHTFSTSLPSNNPYQLPVQQPYTQQYVHQQPAYFQQTAPQFHPVQSEQQRIQPHIFGPDPAFLMPSHAPQSTNHNIQQLKMLFPFVSNFTDEYILSQPLDTLYRLHREEKHAEAGTAARGLEAKLHQNLKKAMDNPVFLDGYDNRTSFLHPARFLAGAGVPVSQLWLEARKNWGQDGKDAIGNYDLEALGCSGCVTAKGWEVLHKPGSPDLSLKLFTITNVGHSSTGSKTVSLMGEDGFTVQDSWKDLEDMGEVKKALDNLLIAAQLAMPWNFSFQVLKGFLKSYDYFDNDLSGQRKAPIISGFVDHVLKVNAGLWVQESPFLDAAKLHALWKSWWSSRKSSFRPDQSQQKQSGNGNTEKGKFFQKQKGKQGGQQQQQQAKQQQAVTIPNFSGPPSEFNICKRFNEKKCPMDHTNCTIRTKVGILRLYHVCNSMVQKDGNIKKTYCLEKHPRVDNH